MKRPLILIFLKHQYGFWCINQHQVESLRSKLPDFEIIKVESRVEAEKLIGEAIVYYGWKFDPLWVPLAKKLKWITTPAAGRDYIESDELIRSGIEFSTTAGFHGRFMAQHALGMLLYFSKQLGLAKETFWPRDQTDANFFDLIGQKMLIVGCGSIGEEVGALAAAFGIKVYGYRRSKQNVVESKIAYIDKGELDNKYQECKIILNLLPHVDDTQLYFNQKIFNKFGQGKVFINLGRGKTVCEKSLLDALNSGNVMYAGLDVLFTEPPEVESILFSHPRVLITPHSSAFSQFYIDEALEIFVNKLTKRKKEFM